MIILISGKAGSGKDFTGDELYKYFKNKSRRILKLSYAHPIKKEATKLGWDGVKDEKGRLLLQKLGKSYREYNKEIFVKNTIKKIKKTKVLSGNINEKYCYIITDARFINEIELLEKEFGDVIKIRVNTDKKREEKWANDVSECELDNYKDWDFILNNTFSSKFSLQIKEVGEEIMSNLFGYNKYLVSNGVCVLVPRKKELVFDFPNGFVVSILHTNYSEIDVDIINPELNEDKVQAFRKFIGDKFLSLEKAKETLEFVKNL